MYMLHVECVLRGCLPCWWVYTKVECNVSYCRQFSELSRHVQPYSASKSNKRHRYLLNKQKYVAVASCLYVTNKISIPSYKLQVLNQMLIKYTLQISSPLVSRLQLKCDVTRWHTEGEVKGKLTFAVGSHYPSHYLGTRCIQHYYRWWRTPRLPAVDWTDAPPTGLI
jgi:hypothetical protein